MICSFQNNMSIFSPLVSVRLVFMCPLNGRSARPQDPLWAKRQEILKKLKGM